MEREIRPFEGRLKTIVVAYMPVAIVGAIAIFARELHGGGRRK